MVVDVVVVDGVVIGFEDNTVVDTVFLSVATEVVVAAFVVSGTVVVGFVVTAADARVTTSECTFNQYFE